MEIFQKSVEAKGHCENSTHEELLEVLYNHTNKEGQDCVDSGYKYFQELAQAIDDINHETFDFDKFLD